MGGKRIAQQSAENRFLVGQTVDVIVGTHYNRAYYRAIGEVVAVEDPGRRSVRIAKVFASEGEVYDNFVEGSVQTIHVDLLFAH